MRAVVFGALVGAAAAQGPVKKVVDLLKDMKAETEANQKTDAETFKKLECWCKKTLKETTKAIEEATDCIATEQTNEENGKGTHSKKKTEASNLTEDIKELNQQIADATAAREKEAAEFNQQEKDLIQSIGALQNAITVLKKHNKGFLQEATSAEFKDKYGKVITKYEHKLSPSQRTTMENFLQQPSSAAYQSQSGEIFGILESMFDEMSADLSDAQKDEAAAQNAFATMKETKTKIANDKTELRDQAAETSAAAEKAAMEAKQQAAACQKNLEANNELKANAESTCESGRSEYAERSKTVALELEAIDQAIGILDSEDAFAAFQKTTDAGSFFLQRTLQKLTRAKTTQKIMNLAAKARNDDFSQNFGLGRSLRNIAALLQTKGLEGQDAQFQKILNAVDEQIKAKADLIASITDKKDNCVANINTSKAELTKLTNEIENLEAKMDQLTTEIDTLTENLAKERQNVKDITDQTTSLSQERSEANSQYQKEMQENQAAVQLLEQAKAVLQNFYGAKAFVQQPQFNAHSKNAGGNKVISMMDQIINDTKTEMKVAQTTENEAQKAYEKQVKSNNDAVKAAKESIANMENQKANAEIALEETTQERKAKGEAKADEQARKDQLHHECDFTTGNFDAIIASHTEEKEGLVSAKTIIENVIADLKG
jgi:chromosome segregation ATPase